MVRERLETAFSVAEREYGVTRLLDPEGRVENIFSFSVYITIVTDIDSIMEMINLLNILLHFI